MLLCDESVVGAVSAAFLAAVLSFVTDDAGAFTVGFYDHAEAHGVAC